MFFWCTIEYVLLLDHNILKLAAATLWAVFVWAIFQRLATKSCCGQLNVPAF